MKITNPVLMLMCMGLTGNCDLTRRPFMTAPCPLPRMINPTIASALLVPAAQRAIRTLLNRLLDSYSPRPSLGVSQFAP